jgi:hypothetical protein
MKYTVTGPFPVSGVEPGRTVDLDPDKVNVDALLESGHIAVPQAAKKAKGGDSE